jgi:uncharacterized protein (DUF1499 family)
MRIALLLIVLVVLAGLAWIRLAPIDPARWHGDPLTATRTTAGGWLVRPEGGDAAAPDLATDPATALAALDRIALATPRTQVLAGSVAEGRITYVTRSALMGFPDLTTVTVLPAEGGVVPVIFARQVYGDGDMGVNRARVEGWLAALEAAVTP